MKTIRLSILVILIIGGFACKKSGNAGSTNTNVSNDEAADIVASSFSLNSGGVATASDDATNVANSLTANLPGSVALTAAINLNSVGKVAGTKAAINPKTLECGVTKTDTITRSGSVGASITYNYTSIYSFTLNCNNSLPDSLTSSSAFTGTYSGPIISSVFTGTTNFSVTGLPAASTNFVINGTYTRNGAFQSKRDTTNTGTHSVTITIKNLTITKSARTILSGTANISVTGTTVKKGSWSYTGTLTYNNDGTATLSLSGINYKINILTGIYVRL